MLQNSSSILLNLVRNCVCIAILCVHLKCLDVTVNCFHGVAWLELAPANDLWWVKVSSVSSVQGDVLTGSWRTIFSDILYYNFVSYRNEKQAAITPICTTLASQVH
jgi:hypothetical protein